MSFEFRSTHTSLISPPTLHLRRRIRSCQLTCRSQQIKSVQCPSQSLRSRGLNSESARTVTGPATNLRAACHHAAFNGSTQAGSVVARDAQVGEGEAKEGTSKRQ